MVGFFVGFLLGNPSFVGFFCWETLLLWGVLLRNPSFVGFCGVFLLGFSPKKEEETPLWVFFWCKS